MADITFVEDITLARASDPDTGLNANFKALSEVFGIGKPAEHVINFDQATSKQLLIGEIHPDDMEKTSAVHYPVFNIYVKNAVDRQENKGGEFSGDVYLMIRLLLSWRGGDAMKVNYDRLAKCFIAAMGSTFNRQLHKEWASPAIALPFSWQRTAIERAAENWRQGILYTMPFIVEA